MALNALGIDTKASDLIWIHVLSEKLDSETAKEWQLTNVDGKLQSMDSLRKCLELRARALEASGGTSEQKREPMKENRNGNEKPDDAKRSTIVYYIAMSSILPSSVAMASPLMNPISLDIKGKQTILLCYLLPLCPLSTRITNLYNAAPC